MKLKFHRKLLIFLIIVISFLTINLLFLQNRSCTREGMTVKGNVDYELNRIQNQISSGISSVSQTNYPIRQYCIKSSYNTALSGKYVSVDAIKYVLSRGCRFVDFEIFLIDDEAQVAYTDDPTFVTVTTKNYITLNEALKHVAIHAFSSPSPNMHDPLFIQFRIKSKNPKIFNLVGMAVDNYLSNKLYRGKVTGSTILSQLMGKVVLIIDKSLSPTYDKNENYPKCFDNSEKTHDCHNLSQYVNIESGTSFLRNYTYFNLSNQLTTPPSITDYDSFQTDVVLLRIVAPDDTKNFYNPSSRDFIQNYGVQFISNRFYIKDSNLTFYEQIFSKYMTAFVPFAMMISDMTS